MSAVIESIRVVHKGLSPYEPTLKAMRGFTAARGADTPDELWLLEHPPIYTLGLAADRSHGPKADNGIPLVQVERGGEVTYHGPGQVVLYTLVDLARRGLKVKRFVWLLEQAVIDLLDGRGERKPGAPGIYVNGAKVAALGIRVTRGCSFHGLALNVDMDLAPFQAIDPCGYPGLRVTQTRDLGIEGTVATLGRRLSEALVNGLEHA
jgi:lipoyl(octanoyl) transferase